MLLRVVVVWCALVKVRASECAQVPDQRMMELMDMQHNICTL